MKANWLVAGMLGGVVACSSGYSQFYSDYSQGNKSIAPATSAPKVANVSGTPKEVIYTMFTNGYTLVGESSFNAPSEDTSQALTQAKKVGAEYVVLRSNYTNTVSGSIPITTQQNVTSRTNGTATAYGTGGMATGTYSGTTTTTVPVTTYTPYSVRRYDQSALYFAPMKEPCLGVLPEELSDDEKIMLGTNKGLRVAAVRKGSPAYDADILPNDYILTVNQQPVIDTTPAPKTGQKMELGIVRGRNRISVQFIGGPGCTE
ncbi:PDZ domain-containing protein [Hyphomonas sp. GM-8P]|uniref:PDZ domain-containing protein n=1 Tax=Hyphomonas sp. GM-8P TaxID=1280945 RepID=UPI0011BE6A6B|nr:PDZ domain-containing protein [Hyphomonas sp. GM-8P]